jgi:HAD superfamily hydrolase (TIGR01509 family)
VTIRGVLLDSGGVLMQPRGGRWNPRFDFEEIVGRHEPRITDQQFADAIGEGHRFLAACTETPEYHEIHRVILGALNIEATDTLLAELVAPLDAALVVEVFDDVIPTLVALRDLGVRMAVVSDAWEGLDRVHAELGIGEFFQAYAISQVVGCSKPDPRMYRHASDALGLDPSECFYVDDWDELVVAAQDLGYHGAHLLRDPAVHPTPDVPTIRSLAEVLRFV